MKNAVVAVLLGTVVTHPLMGQRSDGPIEVPLRVHDGRLVVPVQTPSGSVTEFLLSTGIPATVLSRSGAAKATEGEGYVLAGVAVPGEGFITIPDADLTMAGKTFDGMIGPNFLNQFDVLIDLPNERLVLKPFGTSVVWEGMHLSDPVRLRVYHGVVIGLDVEFAGNPYPAMLDLGTPNLVVNDRVQEETGIGLEADVDLSVGNRAFTGLPSRVRELEVFDRFVPNGDGFVIVGAAIARGCAISISWVHREIRTCAR